ncbi:putative lanthionine biosynthesis protein [Streptomyces lydicamycinicus]|uniref:Putative lanthionine biosynthesis protein n=2 Tax=Streptomyces lydicamycinicus TaxID=1546107 RepID=A0A0N7YLF9_9ACTN|nr:putative lanthionine biosynthesis protein [Streptomyces lydicamycinicus]
MASRRSRQLYRCGQSVLVRAACWSELDLPAWPDMADDSPGQVQRWREWLAEVWALSAVAEAIELASPDLAQQVGAVCSDARLDVRQVRRTVLSVIRYVMRMTSRATPFGLFAGVAPAEFGAETAVRWGERHRALARADSAWLSDVIGQLEAVPEVLCRLPLMANAAVFLRGNRLVVPYPPRRRPVEGGAVAEARLRYTAPVRVAVEAARAPVRYDELVEKVAAEFPKAAGKIAPLIETLVEHGALITSLHAPSTTFDAFAHLMDQVEAARIEDVPEASEIVGRLRSVRRRMNEHSQVGTGPASRCLRAELRGLMTDVSAVASQPLAVDLRVDCSLTLPREVRREAESAATALAQLTAWPFGTAAWKEYHNRFFERYGIGSLVPLRDVVDPDIGLGFPAGYLDGEPEPEGLASTRDHQLLALAQSAALDGRDEVQLDEQTITELQLGDRKRLQIPPHFELRFQLHAESVHALDSGDFTLSVISASRGVGTLSGRFIGLLDESDRARAAREIAQLPTTDPGTRLAQLSFAPLDPSDAHVTRAPALAPEIISVAEHRPAGPSVIPLSDLAVGCDRRRLYLASVSRKARVDAYALHALDLRTHTPPLARFLSEIGKAQAAVVTGFTWGIADRLPFLPRLRYGRTVLSPARWRLTRSELPSRAAPWKEWREELQRWAEQRRLPKSVYLTEGDRLLHLDLGHSAHLELLRSHLDVSERAVLAEAPQGTSTWFSGHAHEITVPMTAAVPPQWPAAPAVSASRLIGRGHGRLPGGSEWLMAKLYGHNERQPEILGHYLPQLLAQWDQPPAWWYMRYRDPRPHIRLRVALPDPAAFGQAAAWISRWADGLREDGLLSDLQFATSYPETGRWGRGAAMQAVEAVFAADSRCLAQQFALPGGPHPQVLAASNLIAIAVAFSGGSREGMDWMIRYGKIHASEPLDRHVLAEAVRLADPSDNWAGLRAAPGGETMYAQWAARDRALGQYRELLRQAEDVNPDTILDSLLHGHHIRAAGIDKDDERTCLRLARAAALAWKARHS